jgi:hypothetical protein
MTTLSSTCPNCAAELTFLWPGAVQTSCPACKSVLIRDGADLKRLGTVGDVPESMSRLQLGAEGKIKGKAFVVVGRIVYRYGRGHWSEWHIRIGDESAWLSDANGTYVVTREVSPAGRQGVPKLEGLHPGDHLRFGQIEYTVAAITRAKYSGVEGELPFEYWDAEEATFVDLKVGTDGFGTIDYSDDPPKLFLGEYESFEELALKNLREEKDVNAAKTVTAKAFNCTKCGAPVEVRSGDFAENAVCAACGSILDAKDPRHKVLREQKGMKRWVKPLIPLGLTGRLKGIKWTVLGFQERAIAVDGVSYEWREYLLWNPDAGVRYLTEYEGHWNDVTVLKGMPTVVSHNDHEQVEYLGTRFKHFQFSKPRTNFVLGEFPWEVRADDELVNDDFVAPPLMLSRERTADELTWSIGTYTEPERIREAFKLKDPLPTPKGTFANQPNPVAGTGAAYLKIFALFAAVLALMAVLRWSTARSEQVFTGAYGDNGGVAPVPAFVTPTFELKGRTSNVDIRIASTVNNDWRFFNIALLADSGGRGYELGREASYYYGVSDGEGWSEGSRRSRAMIASVPPGRYYLRVQVDRDGASKGARYDISVRRDVPRIWPYLLGFLALLVPTVLAFVRERQFEYARWQESDYAVDESEDEEEDYEPATFP